MRGNKAKDRQTPEEQAKGMWLRIKLLFYAIGLILLGGYGLWSQHITLPGGRRRWSWLTGERSPGEPVHFYYEAAIVLSVGAILVSVALLAEIAAYCAQPQNSPKYRKLALYTAMPGIALIVLAVIHR